MRIKVLAFTSGFRQFRLAVCAGVCVAFAVYALPSAALQVQLQEGTATFSQLYNGGPFTPAQSIDGNTTNPCCALHNGWSIHPDIGFGFPTSQTAVWETASNVDASSLTFKMYFDHWNPKHLLGRFRLSVTQDDRSTFADGLHTNGDVSANWTVLRNAIVLGPSGMTFTTLSDDSIFAGGVIAGQGIYEVTFNTNLFGITGIRLEAIADPNLPQGGPGYFPSNGNFGLTEIELYAVPITDTTPPVLKLPDPIVVDATSPAGATVDYTVTATDNLDPNPTVTCTPPKNTNFAIGTTTVSCTATDAANNSTTGTFTVTVNGAMEQLLKLLSSVGIYSNPWGVTNSLATKLQNAIDALNAMNQGSTLRACNSLNAFISEAQAQLGKKLMPDAAELIVSANQIRAVLGCP